MGGNTLLTEITQMSKAFANTKLFAAATILFAAATIFNATVSASSTSGGTALKIAPASTVSEPVVKLGPTLPPSPWDDQAPAPAGGSSLK
jgi:hypothetical protein